jgi:hypothetical protein
VANSRVEPVKEKDCKTAMSLKLSPARRQFLVNSTAAIAAAQLALIGCADARLPRAQPDFSAWGAAQLLVEELRAGFKSLR